MKELRKVFAVWAAAALLLGACADQTAGIPHPPEALYWPSSILVDTDGQHLYVVNGNFDRRYRSGSLAVVDLVGRRVVGDRTLSIGAFGGRLIGRTDAAGGALAEILLPIRSTDEVARVRVERPDGESPRLDCGGRVVDGETRCTEAYILGPDRDIDAGDEPYAAALIPVGDTGAAILVTSGLADGRLFFFRSCVPADDCEEGSTFTPITEEEACEETDDETCVAGLREVPLSATLGSGVQDLLYHPGAGELLATQRSFALFSAIPLELGVDAMGRVTVAVGDTRAVSVPSPTGTSYGQGMAMEPSSGAVAMAWRVSPSLVMVAPDSESLGGYRLADQITIGRGASEVAFGAFGPGDAARAFVTCGREDRLYVVDPAAGRVTNRVETGRGPHAVAVLDRPDLGRRWVLTGDFEDGTITIIEGDPTNPGWLEPIAHVHGATVLP